MKWFYENELPKITDIDSLELAMGSVKARFNGHPHQFTRNDYLLLINTLYSVFLYLLSNSGTLLKDITSEYKPNVGFVPISDTLTKGMNLTEVVEKIFLNSHQPIDTLSDPYIYKSQCLDGYKEYLINWTDSISDVYYTIDGTDIEYDEINYAVTNGTLLQKSGNHGYIKIYNDCTLKLIALPKLGLLYAPSKLVVELLYYDCKPAEKVKLDWSCAKIKELSNDCDGIKLHVENSAIMMLNMIVFYTVDGSDVDIIFDEVKNSWVENSASVHRFYWEGNAKTNLTDSCTLKVVFAPAGDFIDTHAPSDQCEKVITKNCVNKTFIVEGGINPIGKTYTEYDEFGDPETVITIQEGMTFPLTAFCLLHDVDSEQYSISDNYYVVIPKNTTFKLYITDDMINRINITYLESELVGWPQSTTFNENYLSKFSNVGQVIINDVLYNKYEYILTGDVLFKITN